MGCWREVHSEREGEGKKKIDKGREEVKEGEKVGRRKEGMIT